MGDRIVVLHEGRIQQIDTPLNLYNHPVNKFVAGFIGSPSMNFIEGMILREGGLFFRSREHAFTVPLRARQEGMLAAYEGRPVVFGVRPEDMYVAGSPYATRPMAEVELRLDVVEPMGNEIFLYAGLNDRTLVARVAPQPLPSLGEPINIAFDLDKLHFFDAETEQAVQRKVPAGADA